MIANRWRKDLFLALRRQLQFLRERPVTFPEILTLSTGAKGNMFELGGQDHSSGMAMIIAAPSGKPTHSRILHRRWPNELHAAMKVWRGCLVAIGYHSMGKEALALYTVENVSISNEKNFGTVELKRLASKVGNPSDNKYWYEIESIPGVDAMVVALKEKLYYYNCSEPVYIEWFHNIKREDKYALLSSCEARTKERNIKQDKKGIGDSSIENEAVCSSFDNFMHTVKKTADDLNENYRQKFVWVQFGYFLKKDGTLVCQARHLTNEYGPKYPVTPHDTMHIVEIKDVNEIREYLAGFNPDFQSVLFGVNNFEVLWKGIRNDPSNTMVNFTKYAKCTGKAMLPAEPQKEKVQVEEHTDVVEETFDTEEDEVTTLVEEQSEQTAQAYYTIYHRNIRLADLENSKFVLENFVLRKIDETGASLVAIESNLELTPKMETVHNRVEAQTTDERLDVFDISHSVTLIEDNAEEAVFCINCYHNVLDKNAGVDNTTQFEFIGFTVQ